MIDLIEKHYKLKTDPFRLTSDHRFVYPHPSYMKALAYLKFAAYQEEGFVMITGRPGTGKTTLVNEVMSTLDPKEVLTAALVTTQLEAHDLLHMITSLFRIDVRDNSKSSLLLSIEQFLKNMRDVGRRVILIVDEAQGLRKDAVEELRLLSNLVTDGRPLLQIFLVGQEELRELVRSPALDQLRQRIIAASHLEPLTEEEAFGYVQHRLNIAGWKGDPKIENAAVKLIYPFSAGIPRKVNTIFSRLLLHGCIEEKHQLDRSDAKTVISELKRELLIYDDLNTLDDMVCLDDEPTGFLQSLAQTRRSDSREEEIAGEPTEIESPCSKNIEIAQDAGLDTVVNPEDEQLSGLIAEPGKNREPPIDAGEAIVSNPPDKHDDIKEPVIDSKYKRDDAVVIEPDGIQNLETEFEEELIAGLIGEAGEVKGPVADSRNEPLSAIAEFVSVEPEKEMSAGHSRNSSLKFRKLAGYFIGVVIIMLSVVLLVPVIKQAMEEMEQMSAKVQKPLALTAPQPNENPEEENKMEGLPNAGLIRR
jgi:type II secretory pathway predicted ATPase ExeA